MSSSPDCEVPRRGSIAFAGISLAVGALGLILLFSGLSDLNRLDENDAEAVPGPPSEHDQIEELREEIRRLKEQQGRTTTSTTG